MKANYLLKNKYRRYGSSSGAKKLLALLALAILIFTGYKFSLITRTQKAFNNAVTIFRFKSTLVRENSELQEKASALEAKVSLLERNLAVKRWGKDLVVKEVVSRPPENSYDFLSVNLDGKAIQIGSMAYFIDGVPIGRVSEIIDGMAKIKLFSTALEKTEAILERDGARVELVGAGGGNFKLEVPRDMKVGKGDKILWNAEAMLAIVEDTSGSKTDAFKTILAKSPYNIFTIELILLEP